MGGIEGGSLITCEWRRRRKVTKIFFLPILSFLSFWEREGRVSLPASLGDSSVQERNVFLREIIAFIDLWCPKGGEKGREGNDEKWKLPTNPQLASHIYKGEREEEGPARQKMVGEGEE